MGKIDTETKAYMSDPFHFADVFNYLIYDGEPVIDPNELKPLDATEITVPYGNNARAPEQKYRDVLKLVSIMQDGKAIYVVLGAENQTKVHYAIAVKNMLYDAINYARQVEAARKSYGRRSSFTDEEFLSGFRKSDRLMPVITLVVFFGADAWDGPMSIHEMLNTSDQRLLRFVPDYQINLIAPSQIPDGDFDKFSTDLKEVFEFIKYSRDKEKLVQLTEQNDGFSQMEPGTAALINLVTDAKLKLTEKEGKVDMCLAMRELREESIAFGEKKGMAKGMAEGKAVGMAEGIVKGQFNTLVSLVRKNLLTVDAAAEEANMTVDEFIKQTGISSAKN